MAPQLTAGQIEKALELQRKCWTHHRIASELGCHRTTVTRLLSRHNRRALVRLEKRLVAIKYQHISQLEWTAEEAAAAWLRSREDSETIKTTATDGDGADKGPTSKTETTVAGQSGNPAFLSNIRAALADIRKVLGIEAAAEKSGPVEARDAWQEIKDKIEADGR